MRNLELGSNISLQNIETKRPFKNIKSGVQNIMAIGFEPPADFRCYWRGVRNMASKY